MIPKKIFQTFETSELPMGMAKACLSWKHKNPKGREIEDKLIREGLNNNSAKILNKKVGINK